MNKKQQFHDTRHCGRPLLRQRYSLSTLNRRLSGYCRNSYWMFIFCWSLLSCHDVDRQPAAVAKGDRLTTAPDENDAIDPKEILRDYDRWYAYTYDRVQLSQDFIGLDADSNRIDKQTFLHQLMTEDVIAFRIRRVQGIPVYKLYKPHQHLDNIRSTAAQLASIEMKNFQMEGALLPEFRFTDLNGQSYATESVKGKLLVLKCWFIHCTACVQEFPDCNALVDAYKDRKDVLFVSLASDEKKDLEAFLKTRAFRYAVIPKVGPFMVDKLHINSYPTHILVGPDGKILKVVGSIDELKPFLKRAADHLPEHS